jgi:hypothetical protein
MSYPELQCCTMFQTSSIVANSTIRKHCIMITNDAKYGRNKHVEYYLSNSDTKVLLDDFFDENSILVPIPKSAPFVSGALWPSDEICQVLQRNGYGTSIVHLIRRKYAVKKAHLQTSANDRLKVPEHRASLELEPTLFDRSFKSIILVDDFVTQGRTSTACYHELTDVYPDVKIKLFAPVRREFGEINKVFLPKRGKIASYASGKTHTSHYVP